MYADQDQLLPLMTSQTVPLRGEALIWPGDRSTGSLCYPSGRAFSHLRQDDSLG